MTTIGLRRPNFEASLIKLTEQNRQKGQNSNIRDKRSTEFTLFSQLEGLS